MALTWTAASPFGIWFGDRWPPPAEMPSDAWNSGHMNELLVRSSGGLIATADSGGIWLVPTDGSLSTCVSDDWGHSRFNSLAFGPDGEESHVYAAGEALYVTDVSAPLPLLEWAQIAPMPDTGTIHRVVVLEASRLIVIAADRGVFWSRIPQPPKRWGCLFAGLKLFVPGHGPGDGYVWRQAVVEGHVGAGAGFRGLAAGPLRPDLRVPGRLSIETVIAGGIGGDSPAGIFNGQWELDGELHLRRASLSIDGAPADLAERAMVHVSVASCDADRHRAYALCAQPGPPRDTPHLMMIVSSSDGGLSWVPCSDVIPTGEIGKTKSLRELASHQGDYNNAIAVSPIDPRVVAFGFVPSFVSVDAGATWDKPGHTDDYEGFVTHHLHDDQHGVAFPPPVAARSPMDPSARYFASHDGGMTEIRWGMGAWIIESDYKSDGAHGDLECVVLEGNELVHYKLRSDAHGEEWERVGTVTDRATGPGCIIQSDFGDGDHGNFEVVVLEGSDLVHYWHDNSTAPSTDWIRSPHTITTKATGPGCVIQGDFGDGDHGNFELVVPEGNDLVHYWHDNSDADKPWSGGTTITSNAISAGRLIQSDYFQSFADGLPPPHLFGDAHGNFELVVLEGDDGAHGRGLVHYARDNSGFPWPWSPTPTLITTEASEAAALFQSDYGGNGHGNFELIVNDRGALTHWIRDNSAGQQWGWRGQISPPEDNASGPACGFQSNHGSDDDHGDYEVVAPIGGRIVHYRRDATQGKWSRGATISSKSYTFRSDFNRLLPTLQFRKQIDGVDFPYGRGDASQAVSGLVAGGTQDNGVLYGRRGRHVIPWLPFRGGDGHAACFLPARPPISNAVLAWNDNSGKGMVNAWSWDAQLSRLQSYPPDPGVIPMTTPPPSGLRDPRMETVVAPQFPSATRLLCAVAARDSDVFGLFAGAAPVERPTQPELRWERITTLPGRSITPDTRVTALACFDGREILVAARFTGLIGVSNDVELHRVDVATGTTHAMPVDPALGKPDPIAIAPITATQAFAATGGGRVLVWDGQQWQETVAQPAANGRLVAMAADRSWQPPVLFVASDERVFRSPDLGASWLDASGGLPRTINCADLRLVDDGEGVHLYLWSFGRSLWFTSRSGDGW